MGKHDHKMDKAKDLIAKGKTNKEIAEELEIPLGSITYLIYKWKLKEVKIDCMQEVSDMLDMDMPVQKIAQKVGMTPGKLYYYMTKWGLSGKTLRAKGKHFSDAGSKSVSEKLKKRHAETRYTVGDKHWSHGIHKVRGKRVSEEEMLQELKKYSEQDLILAEIAELMGVVPRTITIWLKKFGLQKGIRSGARCSWWKDGNPDHYRGSDWGKQRLKALTRDEFSCTKCNIGQIESFQKYNQTLNVHHKIPWRITHDNSLENLTSMCPKCHTELEWKNGTYKFE